MELRARPTARLMTWYTSPPAARRNRLGMGGDLTSTSPSRQLPTPFPTISASPGYGVIKNEITRDIVEKQPLRRG